MNKALIVIDYTVDFIADDGALTCGKSGQKLEKPIVQLTKEFASNGDFVIFAVDCHTEGDTNHPEAALFPPHNIEGTVGRHLYGDLQTLYNQIKQEKHVFWMDKTRYSAFAGTNLLLKLRERRIDEVHLVGCCTDICILHTAVDAYNNGFSIVIHKDAVASFDQKGHEWALNHFQHTLNASVL